MEAVLSEVHALEAMEDQHRYALRQHEDKVHTQLMELGRLGCIKLLRRGQGDPPKLLT